MKKTILFFAAALCCAACTKNQPYTEKIEELRDSINMQERKISALQDEIEQYKNTPEKVAANIDQLYKDRNLDQLYTVYHTLVKYHPEAKETASTKAYIDKINAEKEAKLKAEKEAKKQAIKKLKKKYDDVSDINWYYNNYFTHYNNTNHVSLYMGQRGQNGFPWLRLKMSYNGDYWIFFEEAYLSYDGNTKQIPFNKYEDKESDNEGGYVWEWIDVSVDSDLIAYLRRMVESKAPKMRFTGKYSKTRNLSSSEINAIKDILNGYDYLNDSNNRE